MAPVLSKEAILAGSVDQLCLACERYLRGPKEALQHAGSAGHKENLARTRYVDEYTQDRVRKVKKWYFCEFCNVLMSTATTMGLHVQEPGHKENKLSQTTERAGDVIVCGDVTVQEEAWHGLTDENTCVVCNVEYEDKEAHKSDSTHIINLIQCKVCNVKNNIYRKIDESTFHCLICNEVVPKISAHIDELKHKKLRQGFIRTTQESSKQIDGARKENDNKTNEVRSKDRCIKDKPRSDVEIEKHATLNPNVQQITYGSDSEISCNICKCEVNTFEFETHLNSLHHRDKLIIYNELNEKDKDDNNTLHILNSIPKFQKDNVNVNCESRTAVCTKCTKNLEFNAEIIETHIEEHKRNVNDNDNRTTPELLNLGEKKIAKESKPSLASSRLLNHENESKENQETEVTKELKEQDYIKGLQQTAEEYGLTYYSGSNRLFCQTCNKRVPSSINNIKEHINGESHKNNVRLSNRPTTSKERNERKRQGTRFTPTTSTQKCDFKRVPLDKFTRTIEFGALNNDIIINNTYCIEGVHLNFITKINTGQLRCLVCEVNFYSHRLKNHFNLRKHIRAMNEIPVLIRNDTEFIREIRSGIFHCGYCNIIERWDGMENHLKSLEHDHKRLTAAFRRNFNLGIRLPRF